MYELEILHHSGKRIQTKSHKVLGANSHVCRGYREKTGMGVWPLILNKVNIIMAIWLL